MVSKPVSDLPPAGRGGVLQLGTERDLEYQYGVVVVIVVVTGGERNKTSQCKRRCGKYMFVFHNENGLFTSIHTMISPKWLPWKRKILYRNNSRRRFNGVLSLFPSSPAASPGEYPVAVDTVSFVDGYGIGFMHPDEGMHFKMLNRVLKVYWNCTAGFPETFRMQEGFSSGLSAGTTAGATMAERVQGTGVGKKRLRESGSGEESV